MTDGLKLNLPKREVSNRPLRDVVALPIVDLWQIGRAVSSITLLINDLADVQRMARLITGKDDLKWVTGDGAGGGLYVTNEGREYLVYDWYGRVPAEQVTRRYEFVKDNMHEAENRPDLTIVYLVNYDDRPGYLRVSPNILLFASNMTLLMGNVNKERMVQQTRIVRCQELCSGIDIDIDVAEVYVGSAAGS